MAFTLERVHISNMWRVWWWLHTAGTCRNICTISNKLHCAKNSKFISCHI